MVVEVFGYPLRVSGFVVYSVFVLFVYVFLCYAKFSVVQRVWLTVVSLAFLEVFWESPMNFYSIFSSFHLGLFLRQLWKMFPVYLWFYYAWRFGDWRACFLFVPAVAFEVALILLGVMYFDGIVNRLSFFGAALVNVSLWRFNSESAFALLRGRLKGGVFEGN